MSDLSDRVAIVTGAGAGLGRAHAHALARHGARVLVNDLSEEAAGGVAEEIRQAGGEAISFAASVTDFDAVTAMAARAVDSWGRIDILVNNAGILRDKSFGKMDLADFRLVVEVHLMGTVYCTKAVWATMVAQNYGRIIMTTSGSGLFGNFGQTNYGAAKAGVVGFMQSLAIEGAKNDIRVNALVPVAATAMTAGAMPPEMLELVKPEAVSAGVVYLASETAPSRAILSAGGGAFSTAHITLTPPIFLGAGDEAVPQFESRASELTSLQNAIVPDSVRVQSLLHVQAASTAKG